MLGTREPGIYGSDMLADVETLCQKEAKGLVLTFDFGQSNVEGEIIIWIQ